MSEYQPMKPVLVAEPFDDPDWLFDRKLDGERCGALRRGGKVTLLSRTGLPLGAAYPEVADALAVAGPDLLIDGEIIAFKGNQTSFSQLQQRMGIRDPARARHSRVRVYYYIFDILELDGEDVRPLPLLERKARLRKNVEFRGHLRSTPYRRTHGVDAFKYACAHGWEGMIAKRAGSPDVPKRSLDWSKAGTAGPRSARAAALPAQLRRPLDPRLRDDKRVRDPLQPPHAGLAWTGAARASGWGPPRPEGSTRPPGRSSAVRHALVAIR